MLYKEYFVNKQYKVVDYTEDSFIIFDCRKEALAYVEEEERYRPGHLFGITETSPAIRLLEGIKSREQRLERLIMELQQARSDKDWLHVGFLNDDIQQQRAYIKFDKRELEAQS